MANKQKYGKLLEPFQIRNVKLKNRIVRAPSAMKNAEPDGTVGEKIKGWYEALAKGGAGLVIVEWTVPDHPLGARTGTPLRIDDDRFIPGLSELTQVVHKHNCPVFVQIAHAGPSHNPAEVIGGMQPVAPSSLDHQAEPRYVATARALTVPEIKDIVEKFAQASLRAKKAGFDGIELHSAHYPLLNSFLTRVQNKRQDEYGCQSLENRSRFHVEILQRIRDLVGPDFVVGVRMNGREWGHELGTTSEEAVEFAKIFEKAGADLLHVSAQGYGQFYGLSLPSRVVYPEPPEAVKPFADRIPTGALIPEANAIKNAVSIPVVGGGQMDYKIAKQILKEGKVDLVYFARALIADTEFPNKLAEGREDDIRPCLRCNNCMELLFANQPIQCRVNAFAGNETEMVMKPAERKKKVMIVGAGPAGLEAARVAAERGHKVTIYDKAREIGGLLPMAAFIKGTGLDDLTKLTNYYQIQLKKLGVKTQLGRELDLNLVTQESPDVVILAVGGKPSNPPIPVKDGAHAVNTEQLKGQAKQFVRMFGPQLMNILTKIFLPVGKKVVVIGSDLAGLETAEFLVRRGKEVTIVDEAEQLGEGMLKELLRTFRPWMEIKKITTFSGVKYEEITSEGVTITPKDGERKTIEADTVMIITKYKKNSDLYQALEGKVPELHLIGDAKSDQQGYIIGAIHDGARVGLSI
ncbi:FAD-dependent oxidoreductase [Chloroflexota bacterium]